MKKIAQNIVLLCDTRKTTDPVTIYSDDLEFSSELYYETIVKSLEQMCDKLYVYNHPRQFMDNIYLHQDDIVFSAIWSGVDSRNRKSLIPALCEAYHIKYIGADAWVSSLCQDKSLSKLYCKSFNINIPNSILIEDISQIALVNNLSYPVIIKPNAEGSSIGISDNSIAYAPHECLEKVKNILSLYSPILVEEYIDGIEVAACISGNNHTISLFEIVQLVINGIEYFSKEIWGYQSKIGNAAKVTRKVITNIVPQNICTELQKIYLSLKKVDYMRIDGRIKNGKFYLIELSPDCSLHPKCFMATAFAYRGLSYSDMIYTFIEKSLEYYDSEKK